MMMIMRQQQQNPSEIHKLCTIMVPTNAHRYIKIILTLILYIYYCVFTDIEFVGYL
jgi:hypothetical protein